MRTHSMKLESLAAIALAACAALHAPRADAQARDAQRCTTIANDAQRLDCYDRALRPAPAAKATAPPAAAPSSTITTEDRSARRERRARESDAEPVASAAPARPAAVDPVAPAPSPAPVPAARSAPDTGAATEVRHARRERPPDADAAALVPIVIVQIRSLPGRPVTFVTDKGEAWVQTDNQRQMPAVPFKAAIKPGSMSSFFLVPEDYAHSFRVRRAQ